MKEYHLKLLKQSKKRQTRYSMNIDLMFSSATDQWSTPQEFFNHLNSEFHFTLDPCADENNHKCDLYYTKEQNGLIQNWGGI